MYARYGRATHAIFCCFALLTNLVITIGVIMAGQATIKSLTKDASDEFTVIIMATLFGSYSLIGGLGTTFYVSYFNACLVFVLLIVFVAKIFYMGDERYSTIGNMDSMYNAIMCVKVCCVLFYFPFFSFSFSSFFPCLFSSSLSFSSLDSRLEL